MLLPAEVTIVSTRAQAVKFYWCCQAGVRSALLSQLTPLPSPKIHPSSPSSSQTPTCIILYTYTQMNTLPSVTEPLCGCARPQGIITSLLYPHSTCVYLSTRPGIRLFVMKSLTCPGVTRSLCLRPPPLPPLFWIREKLGARAIWHCHATDRNCRQQKQKHGL